MSEAVDRIRHAFLSRQQEQAQMLSESSDLVTVLPIDGTPSSRFLVRLSCRGLVRDAAGDVSVADRHELSIRFPENYLRMADTATTLAWLAPRDAFNPNQLGPAICIGRLDPGTDLVDIVHRVYELVSWQRVTLVEYDALCRDACVWGRNHPDRFPVDDRPLLYRRPADAEETDRRSA